MSNRLKLNREALYDLVWSEPIAKVAPKIGVSDVALAKICQKLSVPRPPRGYWARLAHGHAVTKPPLPKLKEESPTEHELAPPTRPPAATLQSVDRIPTLSVKAHVTRYHQVVAELRSGLRDGWTDQYGRIRSRNGVRISKASFPRACRILDTLIRELEKRGVSTTIDDNGLRAWVAGEGIRLELHEPSTRRTPKERSKYGYPRWEYVPSGHLSLSLMSRYLREYRTNWSDGSTKSLDDRLGEVVVVFEQAPALITEAKAKERREQLAWERAELCRRRQSNVFKHTKARAQTIDAQLQDLWQAAQIRRFVKAVEKAARAPAATRRLARWATLYADHLDPLVNYRLPKLDEEPPSRLW